MIVCPVCVRHFDWEQAAIVDSASGEHIVDAAARPLSYSDIDRMRNEELQALDDLFEMHGSPSVACPAGDNLPIDYADSNPMTLGVIGAVGSSKSTYLASVYRALVSGAAGTRVRAYAPRSLPGSNHLGEASRKVFDLRETLGASQGKGLRMIDVELGYSVSVRHRLVFVDAAGERLRDELAVPRERYLSGLHALLLLVDPRALPRVARLRGLPATADTAEQVVSNVIANLEMRGLGAVGPIPIPLAVIVAKADELVGEGRYGVADFLMRPECPVDALLDDGAQRRESRAVWDFLDDNLAGPGLLDLIERFENRSLHFASATSCGAENGSYVVTPRPRRVLPPIFRLMGAKGRLHREMVVAQ